MTIINNREEGKKALKEIGITDETCCEFIQFGPRVRIVYTRGFGNVIAEEITVAGYGEGSYTCKIY